MAPAGDRQVAIIGRSFHRRFWDEGSALEGITFFTCWNPLPKAPLSSKKKKRKRKEKKILVIRRSSGASHAPVALAVAAASAKLQGRGPSHRPRAAKYQR